MTATLFFNYIDYAYTPLDLILYKMDNYVLKDGSEIASIRGSHYQSWHSETFLPTLSSSMMGRPYIAIEYNNRLQVASPSMSTTTLTRLICTVGYVIIASRRTFPASEFEPLLLSDFTPCQCAYALSEEEVLAKYHDQFRVKKDMPATLRNSGD